jgi:hypothetical protein
MKRRAADRRIGKEIDDRYGWRRLVQRRLHLTGIGAVQAEIREQHNHVISSPVAYPLRPARVSHGVAAPNDYRRRRF